MMSTQRSARGRCRATPQPIDPTGSDLRRGMASDATRFPWTHYATFTTKLPMSAEQILRNFRDRFVRCLAGIAGREVDYIVAVEGVEGGFVHLHALLMGTGRFTVAELEELWGRGYSKVSTFNPDRGAIWYIMKGFGRPQPNTWDIKVKRPHLYPIVPVRPAFAPRRRARRRTGA